MQAQSIFKDGLLVLNTRVYSFQKVHALF